LARCSAPELTDIADICLAHDAWIISDEIHAELCFDGRVHVPTASLSPEIAKRTITLMSASKAYNIAGLKTSFMIIQDAALRERVNHARCGMVDSVNPLGMEATRVAYSEGAPWLAELKTYLQANRDWLVAAVRSRLPGVTSMCRKAPIWRGSIARRWTWTTAAVLPRTGQSRPQRRTGFRRSAPTVRAPELRLPAVVARRRHPPHGASPDPAQYLKTHSLMLQAAIF
jgi:hypothetical protein